MSTLRSKTLRLAASLPKGSQDRRALLACLCETNTLAEIDSGSALGHTKAAAPEGDVPFDPFALTLFEARALKLPNWKKALPSPQVTKDATPFILNVAKLTAVYNQQNPEAPLTVNPTSAYLALQGQPQGLKFPPKFITLLQNLTRQSLKTLRSSIVDAAIATGA